MNRFFLKASVLFAATAMMLGAFGAHGLKTLISEQSLITFETGVRYQFYHAFALMVSALLYKEYHQKRIVLACKAFTFGIFLFSGSLYLLAILGSHYNFLGIITPFGGLSFIVGWLFLFASVSPKK
jgi:uncharacterized membrane protein YgdD (TMEM256/DUF423 family)